MHFTNSYLLSSQSQFGDPGLCMLRIMLSPRPVHHTGVRHHSGHCSSTKCSREYPDWFQIHHNVCHEKSLLKIDLNFYGRVYYVWHCCSLTGKRFVKNIRCCVQVSILKISTYCVCSNLFSKIKSTEYVTLHHNQNEWMLQLSNFTM